MRPALIALFVMLGCSAQVGSVGAVLARDNDTHALYVRDVPPGLAASKAGLVPGDEIIMIDGYYVRDLAAKEIRALLRGDVGTAVDLTVVRGSRVEHVKVMRTAFHARQPVEGKEEKMEE